MKSDHTLTAARLREVLDYDPETGVFRWKVNQGSRAQAGYVAGTVRPGRSYRIIVIDRTKHRAHRLAWLYSHGAWPTDMVDHRNENKDDNRIVNLREATRTQNHQNIALAQINNKSGFRGVSRISLNRWGAYITTDYKIRYLGSFVTPELAHAAYLAAKEELHPFWATRNQSGGQ